MDFIVAASNLRAENYDIPPADRHKVGHACFRAGILKHTCCFICHNSINSIHSELSLIFFMLPFISIRPIEQTDSWQDHSCHRHHHGRSGGPGVLGAHQDCPRTQEAGVVQKRLHEPGTAFLRLLWAHCCSQTQGRPVCVCVRVSVSLLVLICKSCAVWLWCSSNDDPAMLILIHQADALRLPGCKWVQLTFSHWCCQCVLRRNTRSVIYLIISIPCC